MKGVVVPVRGLGSRVTGLASRALVPWTVSGLVNEGALTVTCHAPLLPVCGLSGPGRGLWIATGLRRVRSRSRSDCSQSRRLCSRSSGRREARSDQSRSHRSHYQLQSHGSHYRSRDLCWLRDRSPLSFDSSRSRERCWRPGRSRWDHAEVVVASQDRCNSGSRVEPAPAVAGSSFP